jgi:hypothetical protein
MMPMDILVPMQYHGFRQSNESEFNTAARRVSSEWSENLGTFTITYLDIDAFLAPRNPPSQVDQLHQSLSQAVPGCLGTHEVL